MMKWLTVALLTVLTAACSVPEPPVDADLKAQILRKMPDIGLIAALLGWPFRSSTESVPIFLRTSDG